MIKNKLKSLTFVDIFVTLSVIVLVFIVIDQVTTEVVQTIQDLIK